MKQPYFDLHEDLARCTSSQHARIWLVWSLVNRRYPQVLTARPRWSELMLCWMLHHATGFVSVFAVLRRRLGHRIL